MSNGLNVKNLNWNPPMLLLTYFRMREVWSGDCNMCQYSRHRVWNTSNSYGCSGGRKRRAFETFEYKLSFDNKKYLDVHFKVRKYQCLFDGVKWMFSNQLSSILGGSLMHCSSIILILNWAFEFGACFFISNWGIILHHFLFSFNWNPQFFLEKAG